MNVGETVTVKVRNPLWSNGAAYTSGVIAEANTYTGTVLPSPKWFGSDKLCLSTGIAEFPFRIIAKEDIIDLSNTKAPEGALQTLWTIAGNKGSSYLVTRDGSRWSCNCLGYSYRKKCTHIDTAKAEFEGEKKLLPCQDSSLLSKKSRLYYKGKIEKEASTPHFIMKGETMVKLTQVGTANAIYSKNKNISHEDFVKEFLASFPEQTAYIAAQYWQNKKRRLSFGLAPVKLPDMYKPEGAKEKKVKVAKVKVDKVTREKKAIEKSVDEIAAIKAKNLQTMKVATLKGNGQAASNTNRNSAADKALRAEIAEKWREADQFDLPSHLTKGQLKAMI